MPKLMIFIVMFAIVSGWLVACSRWESRYLERRVVDEEVVGEWVMRGNSVADLSRTGHVAPVDPHTHRISVLSDHRCRYQTLGEFGPQGRREMRMDAPCEWALTRIAKHQALSIKTRSEPPQHLHYYFTEGADGRLILFRPIADPDLEAYVEYERIEHR